MTSLTLRDDFARHFQKESTVDGDEYTSTRVRDRHITIVKTTSIMMIEKGALPLYNDDDDI